MCQTLRTSPFVAALVLAAVLSSMFVPMGSGGVTPPAPPVSPWSAAGQPQIQPADGPERPILARPVKRVLVFTKTAGFRHASIPDGVARMRAIGAQRLWTVDHTEDAGVFTDGGLEPYDAVVFLSTTGNILNDDQQAAFERYIRAGHGFMGIHAAADTEYDWAWYAGLGGAQFRSHPSIQTARMEVVDNTHPSTSHLGAEWVRRDEWYDYRAQPVPTVNRLLMLDESSYQGGVMGENHPIAWYQIYDGGRSFYTGGGHTQASFAEPDFVKHLEGGLAWVLGLSK